MLLESGPGAAAENMAWDEALLEAAPETARPVLRLYGWLEPAASFGYFQSWSEVEQMTRLRPLIRRPTGGGLVPHDADWTYSLVFPPTDNWYALTARESYRQIHDWIRDAFVALGREAVLSAQAWKERPGQCFAGAERFDVLSGGRKIAGAAQRRTRAGLLIQGSIQPPQGVGRREFEEALVSRARERQGISWTHLSPSPALVRRVQLLTASKYSRPEYNEKR